MKRLYRQAAFIIVISLVLALVFSVGAYSKDPTAQDYMDSRMYPQAINLLNQQIQKSPKNAKAHYQLAICYVQTGHFGDADTSFERAMALNAKLGLTIGQEYVKAGTFQLDRNNSFQANQLFAKGLQYDPGLREKVAVAYKTGGANALARNDLRTAKEFYGRAISYNYKYRVEAMDAMLSRGKNLLSAGEEKRAEEFFEAAKEMSRAEARERLCDIYFEQGKAGAKPSDFDLLESAKKYGSRHNEEILEIQIAKLPGETIRKEMGPNEIFEVGDVKRGQQWRYLYYKGTFRSRVYTHEGTGWGDIIKDSLPWTATNPGKLQIKSDDERVLFIMKLK